MKKESYEKQQRNEMWAIKHQSFSTNYGNEMMSYGEAKMFNQHLGFKDKEEYNEFWQMFKPAYLPENPEEYYS